MATRRGWRVAAIALIILASFVAVGGPTSNAWQATPQPAPPVTISSEILVHATPVAVANPELALGRVTIMPGAVIPVHHHPGTQIAMIVQGELTYTVITGEAALQRGAEPSAPPVIIAAGETDIARPGDTLVESPDSLHQGRNDGDVPVVIYLSTLFPAGAPRSIIVDATPTP